jgi:hypothetical protein
VPEFPFPSQKIQSGVASGSVWQARFRRIILSVLALFASAGFCFGATEDLRPGPHKELVQRMCTQCHGADRFNQIRQPRERWEGVLDHMEELGLSMGSEQRNQLLEYLTSVGE